MYPCCERLNILESKDGSLEADLEAREQHLPTTGGKRMALKILTPYLLFLNICHNASYRPSPIGGQQITCPFDTTRPSPLGGPRIMIDYVITRDDVILLTRSHRCSKFLAMPDMSYLFSPSIIITNLKRIIYFYDRK